MPGPAGTSQQSQKLPAHLHPRETFIPKELTTSLTVGAFTGALGVLFGTATGVVRNRPPVISSILAGVHWFILGSGYNGSKTVMISALGGEQSLTRMDKVKVSTVAGGLAGAASGLVARGPRNILPAAMAFSLLGAGGQVIANVMIERNPVQMKDLLSKWSPLTPLTDEAYQSILEERILKLEVEIALVEDKIASLSTKASRSE